MDVPAAQLRGLAETISERLEVMREVAHYKFVNRLPIRDPAREAAQLDSLGRSAERMGIDPLPFAEQMRLQFSMAASVQEYWMARWKLVGQPAGAPKDLRRVLRTRIDRSNQKLLRHIYQSMPHLRDPPEGLPQLVDLSLVAKSQPVDPALVLELEQAMGQQRWLPSSHQSATGRVRRSGVLRVGTTGDYPPFSFRDGEGTYKGIDVDMARRLAQHMGLRLLLVPTSWPSLARDLLENRFDIAMSGVGVTSARRELGGAFSLPYHSGGKIGIGRCGDAARFTRLGRIDRAGVRVIVNPGGANQAFVDRKIQRASVEVHEDNLTIFGRIADGDADVMVTDWLEAAMQARRSEGALCVLGTKPYERTRKGYWMQDSKELLDDVNVFLERMERSGTLDQLYQAYVGDAWDRRRGRPR